MFILRSAFWLTIGFLLVAPHGTDFGAAATTLKDQAVEASLRAGEQLIVDQITAPGRLPDLLVSVVTNSADLPTGDPQSAGIAVFPRSRPAALS
jgi:hypothetical protein